MTKSKYDTMSAADMRKLIRTTQDPEEKIQAERAHALRMQATTTGPGSDHPRSTSLAGYLLREAGLA